MASVQSPYGLRVAKLLGDLPFSSGMHTYQLLANQTNGFFFGDPVGLVGGNPVPLTATPAAGGVIGVFMGCEYQDPIRGFVNAHNLLPNAIAAGAREVRLKIMDYPWLVIQVQADGPVNYAQVGQNAALGNFNLGSIYTGNSTVNLLTASMGVASAAVRIYDLVVSATPAPGAGSAPGDPFTDVLVVWNFGIHKMLNATGS
jgi:hypothetical protein